MESRQLLSWPRSLTFHSAEAGALDEQAMVRAFARKLENYISRNPEQYVPTLVSHQVNLKQGRVQTPIFRADTADTSPEKRPEKRAEERAEKR